ncbi:MAG: Holliday junction resolvase RuvX [Desulfobacterota bacterium]|nr:Holliday junction resolvase RuvX [Thermodesulfobacteriota bacterium]
MRILCIDFGSKTFGIAVSDELGMFAHGVETIQRSSLRHDIARLRVLVEQYQVEKIIIGLPRNMDGSIGPAAQQVLAFSEVVARKLKVPVETWDERLSTVEAHRILGDAAVRRSRRKQIIDTVAATIILQGYLDAHTRADRGEES